ncbi:hypothetical protein [Aquimarina sp. MMG016]|uniref:hypothetical protein n=1 Tax=Aquimarina sp. MMG016 TaxID=2822690 RepID=UPI001B3A190C|nr:hypothetical protein [Aquimarina sp. MMG016]MBQ4822812.1 hypothetical protein [Aquimarina sp. MMG016]
MLKNILDVKGVNTLNKNQQKSVTGGLNGGLVLDTSTPCGDTGGRIRPSYTSAALCSTYPGSVYLGNGKCMICH